MAGTHQNRITVRYEEHGRLLGEFTVDVTDAVLGKIQQGLPAQHQDRRRQTVVYDNARAAVTFHVQNPVPDVVRYWMQGEEWEAERNEAWLRVVPRSKGFPWGRRVKGQDKDGVMLLLESPHWHELYGDLKPFVPAAGSTGRLLHRRRYVVIYLLARKTGIQVGARAPVIVGNPLQFPASLRTRKLEEKLRDQVWLSSMELEALGDAFTSRLGGSTPKVIINACTSKRSQVVSLQEDTRGRINRWLSERGITRVTRLSCVVTRPAGKSQVDLEIDAVANPEVCVVEMPHPEGWRYISEDGWFPDDTEFKVWKRQWLDRQR